MKVALIGTGRVGATAAFLLAQNDKIKELLLINRSREKAEGLFYDIISGLPHKGETLRVADLSEANDADIIVITAGALSIPEGTTYEEVNGSMIKELFQELKPKETAKIVTITTPPDKMPHIISRVSGLNPEQIIGFGGQLDANRLKYLVMKEIGDFSRDIRADYIGEHQRRGIPVFREQVKDAGDIIERTRNFYALYLKETKSSNYGTAYELAKLVGGLLGEEDVFTVAHYRDGIFITWPCVVNENGVKGEVDIELTPEEQAELQELTESLQKEFSEL